MEQRPLGRTGLSVSLICLGTMTWGRQNTEADGFTQMDMALDRGVNFFDTAEMYSIPAMQETYGATETIIGNWFEKTGKRDKVVLATKVVGRSKTFPYIRPHLHGGQTRLDRASITEALDNSLRRLKTDYIDLYQVHWPERPTNFFGQLRYRDRDDKGAIPLEETLGVLGDLVDAGKIRAVGLSNETAWGVMHALSLSQTKGLPRIASVQNPYNLLNRSYEVGLAEASIREDCGLLAYSPTGFGTLSGKYLDGAKPDGARLTLFGQQFPRYLGDRGIEATRRYVALAHDHGMDPVTMALAFVNRQPFVTSTIIGARTTDQLEVALDSAGVVLPDDLVKAIDRIDDEITFPSP